MRSSASLPPYALAAPAFPFRRLARLAGGAPIGGAREVALGCFVAARLAGDRLYGGDAIPDAARTGRTAGAKGWLGTLALPATVRAPLARCLDLSAEGSPALLAAEIRVLARAAAPWLDAAARVDLDLLATALDE